MSCMHSLQTNRFVGLVIGVCTVVTTTYLAYEEMIKTPLELRYRDFGMIGDVARTFADTTRIDVKKKCAKICDRTLETCFNPESTIFIYEDAAVEDMDFEQTFSKFRPRGRRTDHGPQNWTTRREWCPINDLHYSYNTLTMHRSCAIVGNGGILLGSLCGEEINSHDLVMRANMPGIRGYSSDVGNRTSIMMINLEMTRVLYNNFVKNSNKTSIKYRETLAKFEFLNDSVVWFAKQLGKENIYSPKLRAIAKLLRREHFNTKFAFSYSSGSALTQRIYKTKRPPSSGLILLSVAKTFCRNITLYGFYPYDESPSGDLVPHHYYGPKMVNFSTPQHDFDQEHKKLQELQKRGEIRLVVDPCKHDGTKN